MSNRQPVAKSGFNPVLAAQPRTIFDVMSGLARELDAVNLGQGFPDEDGAPDVREFAGKSLMADSNQYPPATGLIELRQAVADHYRRFQALELDGAGEVVGTSGATDALAAAPEPLPPPILGVIAPGEEWVLSQPLYDAYLPLVRMAGATPRFVRLEPP